MKQLIIFLVITLLCFLFAMIPEMSMYALWNFVHPETDVARVLVLGIFWFGGVGLCVAFGIFGFAIWASAINTFC